MGKVMMSPGEIRYRKYQQRRRWIVSRLDAGEKAKDIAAELGVAKRAIDNLAYRERKAQRERAAQESQATGQ